MAVGGAGGKRGEEEDVASVAFVEVVCGGVAGLRLAASPSDGDVIPKFLWHMHALRSTRARQRTPAPHRQRVVGCRRCGRR
jgi:hypothetical protein